MGGIAAGSKYQLQSLMCACGGKLPWGVILVPWHANLPFEPRYVLRHAAAFAPDV
jgi:hypothetical protein